MAYIGSSESGYLKKVCLIS